MASMSFSYFLFLLLTNTISTYTYYVSQHASSFINSNLYCNTICDSSLASIHSLIQYNSLINILPPLTTVWIGLNDINSETNFTWIDGSPVNYTYWNSSFPPIQDSSTNCVQIHINNTHTTYWEVTACNTQQHFICNDCNITNSPTFEPTTVPTTEPTLEPTIALSLHPTYDPTIEPTKSTDKSITKSTAANNTNDSSNKPNIFLTDWLWLAVGAGTILFLAFCCGICICYQRKKQYNTAMKDKHTHKYRMHLKFASKISNANGNLVVPQKEMVPENSINLEMTEKYSSNSVIVEKGNKATIHLTTPQINDKTKTETSLADLVIGDDAMSPSKKGILEELYRKGTELTSVYGSHRNETDIKMEDIQGDFDTDMYTVRSTPTGNTNTLYTQNTGTSKNINTNSGNITPMHDENETEIGFSVIDYAANKDDEDDHPSESSSFTADSND